MNNVERKIEWAEISGECLMTGNEKGYIVANREYNKYDARYWAERVCTSVSTGHVASGSSKLKQMKAEWLEETYRKMVKANCKSNQR